MKLIIKGDDLGWTDGVNAGMEKAAREGVMTAAGCMPNMPAARRGIEMLRTYQHISIGQHTNVVVGKPVSDPEKIPHLVDENGEFHSSRYYRELKKRGKDPLPHYGEAVIEIEAQLQQFYEYAGKLPDYLEGHAVPSKTFGQAMADVAKKYRILHLNLDDGYDARYGLYRAPLGRYAMDIFHNDDPYAQFGADAEGYFLRDEGKILDKEFAIMVFHPGFVDTELMQVSSFHGVRICDCKALCSQAVKEWIAENNIELVNYSYIREEF